MVKLQNGHKLPSGVPQGSVLGPLLFLVYLNVLPGGLTSNVKFFANDTSVSSVVRDSSSSSLSLNENLSKISQWGYKWKILFNLMLQTRPRGCFLTQKKSFKP